MPGRRRQEQIDLAWVEPFLEDLLGKWLAHADEPGGLFYPHLDRRWRRVPGRECTLVSQSRLVFNFARAFEWRGDERFADAARRGIAALERHFALGADGAWRWSCAADGTATSDVRDSYGHAFVILALATASRALADPALAARARATWEFVTSALRDAHGGLVRRHDPEGRDLDEGIRSQNPMMHSFEALLVLGSLEGHAGCLGEARGIWEFLRARIRDGGIPEWYDASWRELQSGPRAGFDVGHQFEWAYLLSEAEGLSVDAGLLKPAKKIIQAGLDWGYDLPDCCIISPVDLEGMGFQRRAGAVTSVGWWQQCEAIRALARFVARHGCEGFLFSLTRLIEFTKSVFFDADWGGIFSDPLPARGRPSLHKGSAWKLDYHVVNMCLELLAARAALGGQRANPHQ